MLESGSKDGPIKGHSSSTKTDADWVDYHRYGFGIWFNEMGIRNYHDTDIDATRVELYTVCIMPIAFESPI